VVQSSSIDVFLAYNIPMVEENQDCSAEGFIGVSKGSKSYKTKE
jgi:hypothetical protein